jgi:hypothetical protein
MLKKKSSSIYYHSVFESDAMRESLTGHIGMNEKQYCYKSSVWAEAAILGITTPIQHL